MLSPHTPSHPCMRCSGPRLGSSKHSCTRIHPPPLLRYLSARGPQRMTCALKRDWRRGCSGCRRPPRELRLVSHGHGLRGLRALTFLASGSVGALGRGLGWLPARQEHQRARGVFARGNDASYESAVLHGGVGDCHETHFVCIHPFLVRGSQHSANRGVHEYLAHKKQRPPRTLQ